MRTSSNWPQAAVWLAFAAGVLLSLALWNNIELPFSNPWDVHGLLTEKQFNPANNIIRFLMFCSLPTLLAIIVRALLSWVRPTTMPTDQDQRFTVSMTLALAIFFALLAIMLQTYHSNGPFDTFHEGESLGPAVSWDWGHVPYKDSLFVHGLFQDPLRSVLAFDLFGRSIGAVRTLESIINVSTIVLLSVYLVRLFRRETYSILMATVVIVFLLNSTSILIPPRDLTTVLFLLVVTGLEPLLQRDSERPVAKWRPLLIGILLGFIPLASIAYSLDRGLYLFGTSLVVLTLLAWPGVVQRGIKVRLFLFAGIGLMLAFVLLILAFRGGLSEFIRFALFLFPKYKELMDGMVYEIQDPRIFFASVLPAVNLCWVCIRYLESRRRGAKIADYIQNHLTELVLLILSFLFFRNALGRADWEHVTYSILPTFLLSLYLFLGTGSTQGSEPSTHALFPRHRVMVAILLGIVLMIQQIGATGAMAKKFPLTTPDAEFIPESYQKAVAFLKENLAEDERFFTLTSEASWYYFVNRPCPSRFSVVWFAMPTFLQEEIIADLERNNVKYVLFRNKSHFNAIDEISTESRLKLLVSHIRKHYRPDQNLDGQEIWIKKR